MTSRAESDLRDQIEAADTQVGRFYISAHRLDGPGAFAVREREAVPIASMYKVLLALEVAERISTGVLDPHELIAVDPVNHTPAGVGLNQFRWPAYVAVRTSFTSPLHGRTTLPRTYCTVMSELRHSCCVQLVWALVLFR